MLKLHKNKNDPVVKLSVIMQKYYILNTKQWAQSSKKVIPLVLISKILITALTSSYLIQDILTSTETPVVALMYFNL